MRDFLNYPQVDVLDCTRFGNITNMVGPSNMPRGRGAYIDVDMHIDVSRYIALPGKHRQAGFDVTRFGPGISLAGQCSGNKTYAIVFSFQRQLETKIAVLPISCHLYIHDAE